MEKVFIITDRYRLENGHASELNQFFRKNFDYEVKSVTPISFKIEKIVNLVIME